MRERRNQNKIPHDTGQNSIIIKSNICKYIYIYIFTNRRQKNNKNKTFRKYDFYGMIKITLLFLSKKYRTKRGTSFLPRRKLLSEYRRGKIRTNPFLLL